MADTRFFHKKDFFSLGEICSLVGLASPLDPSLRIDDVCSVDDVRSGCLSFIKNKKHLGVLENNPKTAFIIHDSLKELVPSRSNILSSQNPEVDFVKITRTFYTRSFLKLDYDPHEAISPHAKIGQYVRISPGAVIADGAEIGDNVFIGPNAVIGTGVVIGPNSEIHSGATVMCALIGHSVVIHPNAVVGRAGFGFIPTESGILDIPQVGRVIIGDDVHIGAGSTVDRGGLRDTIIGSHSRLDNLVQIGHNVRIGRGCVIVSQVGVAGSTEIGDFSMIAGQVGIADHIKIGKGVKIAAQSGIMRDIEDGAIMGGSPALPIKDWHRTNIALARLIKKE